MGGEGSIPTTGLSHLKEILRIYHNEENPGVKKKFEYGNCREHYTSVLLLPDLDITSKGIGK